VTAPIVYETVAAGLPTGATEIVENGIDAVVFYSASAVAHFTKLQLDVGAATIACVGEASARTAREAGLSVEVFLKHPSNDELLNELAEYFDQHA
jgi:uroporphyrinogen III methyltransferase/synthase